MSSGENMNTINCPLFIFTRGFKRAYKWRGLYPRGLLKLELKKSSSKQALAVLIKMCVVVQFYPWFKLYQHAKKVVSDSLGLVDFAIRLVIFVLDLPDG